MSVSDPLLKRLKQHVLSLRVGDPPQADIPDSHPSLEPLCSTLEEILAKGLRQSAGLFSGHRDCYHWMFLLPDLCSRRPPGVTLDFQQVPGAGGSDSLGGGHLHPGVEAAIQAAKSEPRVREPLGRGRLLVRCLLQRRLIHWPVLTLCRVLRQAADFYDDLYSIVGNDILAEILASLLLELSKAKFALNLRNAAFLDCSWSLPRYCYYEFVPCSKLGLHLVCMQGHQVVETVLPGSVAAEDAKIEPGDILDELLGQCIKFNGARIRKMIKDNQGWPVPTWFIKARLPDASLYQPLLHLLKSAGQAGLLNHVRRHPDAPRAPRGIPGVNFDDPLAEDGAAGQSQLMPIHARLDEDASDDIPAANPDMAPTYSVRYVGNLSMGSNGGVSSIEPGIERVLAAFPDPAVYRPCQLELDEKEVLAIDCQTGEVLVRHAYPQIASCGRRLDCVRFVAYMGGETTCTIARDFRCHVFEARSDYESRTILCSIAQGFERTHWAL
ncbi:hypothetical protein BOX15_Mlig008272g3 [Macrostomum lignano]|uniref:RUN domain-containing protein n=2 Tax=Macrostomum lignano TaxID=282301 RepID=A0A267FU63_9PLAT|nr:hypothetical protein BOX15_Mlig008272g3 [Macrostomum lignano]